MRPRLLLSSAEDFDVRHLQLRLARALPSLLVLATTLLSGSSMEALRKASNARVGAARAEMSIAAAGVRQEFLRLRVHMNGEITIARREIHDAHRGVVVLLHEMRRSMDSLR